MTLKQIEAFYWAANLGSFSIAALRLHVTQSSLSKRVVELEESVGAPLFDRSGKRAQLTEAGQRLLPLADRHLIIERGRVVWMGDSAALDADRMLWTRYLGVS